MKTLSQHIEEKLIINQQVDEKLIINKNFKPSDNDKEVYDEIYKRAELITGWMNNVHCAMTGKFNVQRKKTIWWNNTFLISAQWNRVCNELSKLIDNDDTMQIAWYTHSRITPSEKTEFRRLYNGLVKYIDDNDSEIEYIIDESFTTSKRNVIIKMMNTSNGIVCVAGVDMINSNQSKDDAYVILAKK